MALSRCPFPTDIKKLYRQTGVDQKPTTFLFVDTQIADECFLEDINNILSSGEVPNLYKSDEFEEVCDEGQEARADTATSPSHRCLLSAWWML